MADITINGKSAELWINGRQVLADRVISGTWTALGTVTLPAFTLGGTLDANNKLFDKVLYLTGGANGRGRINIYSHLTGAMELTPYGSFPCEITAPKVIGSAGLEFSDASGGVVSATIKTVKVTKAHGSDLFDAAGLTDSATIWQQPANSVLLAVKARLETQFAGVTTLKVELGLAGDNDGLLDETGDLTADSEDDEYKTLGAYWDTLRAGLHYPKTATEDWVAYATSTVANLDQTSAGSIDFYFTYLEL